MPQLHFSGLLNEPLGELLDHVNGAVLTARAADSYGHVATLAVLVGR